MSFPSRRNSRNLLLLSQSSSHPPSLSSTPSLLGRTVSTQSSSASALVPLQTSDGPPRYYLLGTRLDSRISTWSRTYPGKVLAVNRDGTLLIKYDDGDLRDDIQLGNVCFEARFSPFPDFPSVCPLFPNSQVEFCIEQSGSTWIAGRITEVVEDRFHLVLCNGRPVNNVSRSALRCYIPMLSHLSTNDLVEVLPLGTKSWVACRVLSCKTKFQSVSDPNLVFDYHENIRFPIPLPEASQEEEEFMDATPMILSMKERLSQSIEVGARVVITDKHGGALPKTGKADSAQVSIINFPLPADILFESITFRLFEAPAEDSNQMEVMLFDREQIMVRTHRLSSTESNEESSPQLGPTQVSQTNEVPPTVRFFVSPDLPNRVSRSHVVFDPNSREVQTCALLTPLRGTTGQYLGVMNRLGRLNLAYTPDKKKPGESWAEKSTEVFYFMPRMVPKQFVGGPFATREWHGRAGWYATGLVCDPGDAVDPAFQRRSELHALSRKDGDVEIGKLCWLITSLCSTSESANQVLFHSPHLMHALQRLCQANDAVVELISTLCTKAAATMTTENATPMLRNFTANNVQAFLQLQNALRVKAVEMQLLQQGRMSPTLASFQTLLGCLLAMKRLNVLGKQQSMRGGFHNSTPPTTTRVVLLPAKDPLVKYMLKKDGTFRVFWSSLGELKNGTHELVPTTTNLLFHLGGGGPIEPPQQDVYFSSGEDKELWKQWTSPMEVVFQSKEEEEDAPSSAVKPKPDWLDDLELATELLLAFAKQTLPPNGFIEEHFGLFCQKKHRMKVEIDEETEEPRVWNLDVPHASRLCLKWTRLPRMSHLAVSISGVVGALGHPPLLHSVEGGSVSIALVKRLRQDPLEVMKRSREAEQMLFLPAAFGLLNCQGVATPPVGQVVEGEDALVFEVLCSKCGTGRCQQGVLANVEGRPVSLTPKITSWSCSQCQTLPQPCTACSWFSESLAFNSKVRARPPDSFEDMYRYIQFLKRLLVPGVPVVCRGEPRRFHRLDVPSGTCWTTSTRDMTQLTSHSSLGELLLMELTNPSPSVLVTPVIADNSLAVSQVSSSSSSGISFASNDLGPDIAISNNGLTCTRLRSVGWGSQRLSKFLDPSCGIVTVVFKIERNSSNHLFLGVVQPSFADDWSKRLMEPGAWSIRRDGSLHGDGREQRPPSLTPSTESRLGNGEELRMIVDMSAPVRSVTFIRKNIVLGTLLGLPPRVVPCVSFGGSNQIVSIVSYSQSTEADFQLQDNVVELEIVPEFTIEPQEKAVYLSNVCLNWTKSLDATLVGFVDQMVLEHKLSLHQLLFLSEPWDTLFSSSSSSLVRPKLLQALLDENKTLETIAQRFEWIRALNRSLSKALPLLDLSFEQNQDSVGKNLYECSHLLFDALKRPMWEEALEATRTEEGQFEVILDYGKALAHRQFVDSNARFTVFAQAFRVMNSMPPRRLRGRGQLYRAILRGLRAHDDGGPYRQSMGTYCAELMSTPGTGLFLPCANRTNEIAVNRDRWLPNPSANSALQIQMFMFVGKLMGIAIRNREFLDLMFPTLVWKYLLNRKPTFEDLRQVDLLFANLVLDMTCTVSSDQEEVTPNQAMMNFTCFSLDGKLIELMENGEQKYMANTADCHEWARLATEYKLNEFNLQLEAMRRGIHAIVPQRMLALFDVDELQLMVCGRPQIDLTLLREMTVYVGCTELDAHIVNFWKVLTKFTHEQRSLYLRFVFGRSTLPGSKELWGGAPHKISSFESRTDVDSLLPRSHTCYFSLDLPRYSSLEVLERKLLFAIENCTEIDADQTTTGNRSAALGFELELDLEDANEPQEEEELVAGTSASTDAAPMSMNKFNLAFDSFSSKFSEDPSQHQLQPVHMLSRKERSSSLSSFGTSFTEAEEELAEFELEDSLEGDFLVRDTLLLEQDIDFDN